MRKRVAAVEEEEYFIHKILAPRQRIIIRLDLTGIVKFTALLTFQEIEVDVAVIIRQLALLGMANKS